MASQERISVHNLADLKNTSDDAIPNYLNSLKFKQDHRLVDTRLALGYGAFAIAAACFLWDYKLGFASTKWWTAAAVALYSIVNGGLTAWITFVEKGTVYQGTAPDGTKISVSTSTKKNEPTYYVVAEITSPRSSPRKIEFSRSFTEWFDVQGHFVALPFQTMLASTVPLIAKADPKRASATTTSTNTSSNATAATAAVAPATPSVASTAGSDFLNVDAETLDALAAGEATGTGAETGAGGASGKGKKSKRRKA
ncbi:microsomal signal peptidase 25 kDa subunit-domain-containing protein [Nemania sp. FL0916]|nr:microsomal signal peptidase 25 kDa subunit-domain-containing protein [Nemania sp. FL0916]